MFCRMEPYKEMTMMNNQGNRRRFRHELKFVINEAEKQVITSKIKDVLSFDENAENGEYMIRSLYFDDMWNRAYEEKMSGIATREKYRIRIYNYSDRAIKLERKTKQGSYILKETANLTREEVDAILLGDYTFLMHKDSNLCKEFYMECIANQMRPRVIVDYEREPYVLKEGNVRITFDMSVRAGMLSYDLFDETLPTLPCLEPGTLIMEVKYTEFLPQIIRNILPPENSEMIAVSKYVLCYDKRYGIVM